MRVWRSVAVALLVAVLLLAWLAGARWMPGDVGGDGDEPPSRIAASETLTDASMAALCRPPRDEETIRWDGGPFERAEIVQGLMTSPEGQRVQQIRAIHREVLHRDPALGDCAALRELVDSDASLDVIRRSVEASEEAGRVAEVRQAFLDVFGRDPSGWDHASVRRWVESGLTPADIRGRLTAQKPQIGVHYFTWYDMKNGRWGNGATDVETDAPVPALGRYRSSDPAVMDAHISQMAAAGFDFVIVDIVAEAPASWTNAHALFDRLPGQSLKAAVMLDGLGTASAAAKAGWVEKATREFAGHPNYFFVHDKPLVALFSASIEFAAPAVTMRNVYWSNSYGPGTNTFNPGFVLHAHDWPFWAETPQPLVNGVVPVVPGYSDTHLARSQAMEHARDEGQMYHDQWQRALALRPELIIVYSWNEHFEQTAIEPTAAWGDRYLEWTACYVRHARAGTMGACR